MNFIRLIMVSILLCLCGGRAFAQGGYNITRGDILKRFEIFKEVMQSGELKRMHEYFELTLSDNVRINESGYIHYHDGRHSNHKQANYRRKDYVLYQMERYKEYKIRNANMNIELLESIGGAQKRYLVEYRITLELYRDVSVDGADPVVEEWLVKGKCKDMYRANEYLGFKLARSDCSYRSDVEM